MSREPSPGRSTDVGGALAAVGAFLIWGFAPIYFRSLAHVPALEILAHRVVWSAVLLALVVGVVVRRPAEILRRIGGRRMLGVYAVTTLLVSTNWLVFIWAVNSGHILEASLGYYINPLVTVLLGMVFLRERLSRPQLFAIGLAAAGVVGLVASQGRLPRISLVLAVSFALYGLVRKKASVDPLVGLLVETLLLAPVALAWLAWREAQGVGAFGAGGPGQNLLLAFAGVITAVPLLLFLIGAQRLKLSTVGLVQYVAPTCQLLVGVFLYGERFTRAHAWAFGLIWIGLAIYSADALAARAARERAASVLPREFAD